MRHLDLFAGIGGFSLAAQWMGWTTVAQVEWDEWCQKVLAKNFPDALRFGDIVEFNKMLEDGKIIGYTEGAGKTEIREVFREGQGHKQSTDTIGVDTIAERRTGCVSIGHIDIITGGFPCQPFSHAGKRKGTDDSRYLWPAMLETIRRVKPTYVVGENVAGLVSMENGKTLDRILSDLEDEGYTTEQVIIPACAVGAWHRRDRIWIIAHNNNPRNRTSRSGIDGYGQAQDRKQQQSQSEPCGHSEVISHSAGQRQQTGGERSIASRQEWPARGCYEGARQWQSESSMGRMANGLPSWVDGYWDREPEGVPRVATGVKDRVNRLKGLGNAIVPAVAYEIFKAIESHNIRELYDSSRD